MLKIDTYTLKGTKSGELSLPKEFDVKPNLRLLAQAVHVYVERGHVGTRSAKTRSEINRTTKKVYKQKGTGGARHGSRRANLFVGGGVIFGPRALRRIVTISQAMKAKAKLYAFAFKAQKHEIVGVTGLSKLAKTNEAGAFLKKLGTDLKSERFTFILSEKSKLASRFLKNLGNAVQIDFKNVNALDLISGGTIVLDTDVFEDKVSKVSQVVKEKKVVAKKVTKKGTK